MRRFRQARFDAFMATREGVRIIKAMMKLSQCRAGAARAGRLGARLGERSRADTRCSSRSWGQASSSMAQRCRMTPSLGAELRFANGIALLAKFDGDFASRSSTYAGTGTIRYTW